LRALRNEVVDKMVDIKLRVDLQREQLKRANAGLSLWEEDKVLSAEEKEAFVQALFRGKALLNRKSFGPIRNNASKNRCQWY
jgi:hypothetical protein